MWLHTIHDFQYTSKNHYTPHGPFMNVTAHWLFLFKDTNLRRIEIKSHIESLN